MRILFQWLKKCFPPGLLLPCPWCQKRSQYAGDLCDDCQKKLQFFKYESACPQCGAKLAEHQSCCSNCQPDHAPWQAEAMLFAYNQAGRELMHRFKFKGHPELARPLGKLCAGLVKKLDFPVDAVVFIPMDRRRELRRSYNQAEVLADFIARELNVPVLRLLEHKPAKTKQSLLNIKQRAKNVSGAFLLRQTKISISDLDLLLVDDIFTTGATMTSAAKTLNKAHPKSLRILCCAKTLHR